MSLTTLGVSAEYRGKVAVNSLWPRTGVATAAIEMLAGKVGMAACRRPEIMADAAHWILSQVCLLGTSAPCVSA
jgi:citronellol/citronellal dehydrogenase